MLVTRELVGDEPFAVILGDDVIDADPPAMKQMIDVFERVDGPVLAVERVPRDEISSYGVIAIDRRRELGEGIYQVRDLVEKPPKDEAPSDLAIIGRYILTPDIFPALAKTKSDRTGEIQLTNGLRELLEDAADLRVRSERRPPRHRQQARLPESGGLLRAAAAGPGGQVLRLPDERSTCRAGRQALTVRSPSGRGLWCRSSVLRAWRVGVVRRAFAGPSSRRSCRVGSSTVVSLSVFRTASLRSTPSAGPCRAPESFFA